MQTSLVCARICFFWAMAAACLCRIQLHLDKSIIGAAVAVEADVPSVVVVWYCRGGKRGGACATTEVLSGVDSPS